MQARRSFSQEEPRPVIFLDIDGVLNSTKDNAQIHFEPHLLKRLKRIIETTDALVVLTTFWRHFHEYITYVFHRHKIDVARHMLPLPMGATKGKQCTEKFLYFHYLRQQQENKYCHNTEGEGSVYDVTTNESNKMIGRAAEDEGGYACRAEEIEAWLKMYGQKYLGSSRHCGTADESSSNDDYEFHPIDWKYVILDDRPSAAKPDTPLFDRFVLTETKLGLTEEDAGKAIKLLRFGP